MLTDKPRIGTEYELKGGVLLELFAEYEKANIDPWMAEMCGKTPAARRMAIKAAALWLRLANHLSGEKKR